MLVDEGDGVGVAGDEGEPGVLAALLGKEQREDVQVAAEHVDLLDAVAAGQVDAQSGEDESHEDEGDPAEVSAEYVDLLDAVAAGQVDAQSGEDESHKDEGNPAEVVGVLLRHQVSESDRRLNFGFREGGGENYGRCAKKTTLFLALEEEGTKGRHKRYARSSPFLMKLLSSTEAE
uniref:Uncharacterized protein n=1 Tax=Steinernema glaseri TaxID=37863 RepID=A0A1I8AJA9_9BILA